MLMKNKFPVFLVLLFLFQAVPSYSDSAFEGDTLHHLYIQVGGGPVRYLDKNFSTYEMERQTLAGSARILWQPEFFLGIGIETGYVHFYTLKEDNVATEFGTTNLSNAMNAVPIFLQFNMRIMPFFNIYVGTGYYSAISNFESFGSTSTHTQMTPGFMAGANLFFPITDNFVIGPELKYYSLVEFKDNAFSLQLILSYNLFEW
jgi:hypothetical protein